MKNYDLQDRLIAFSIELIKTLDKLPNSVIGKYLKGQLTRSGTSPTLNYAEACDAESRKDFIHKIKIVLKELRETLVGLKMIDRLQFSSVKPESLLKECDELISVFKLRYHRGPDNATIVQRLGISINTVKVHLAKARLYLKDRMSKEQELDFLFFFGGFWSLLVIGPFVLYFLVNLRINPI